MKLADAHDAQIAIANDPDADRLCACARDSSGQMRQLTGDQLGSLLGDALLERAASQVDPRKTLAVRSTIVSSRILARLAQKKGERVQHRETLTGFKWLGPAAERATQRGEQFVFGYEEALGYMVCDVVYDKDGLSGLVAIAELAYALYRQGLTLWDRLEEIHRAVGLSVTMQRTIKLQPGTSGSTIMKRLRADKPQKVGSYPLALVDDLIERPTKAEAGEEDVPRNDVLRYYVGTPEGRHTKEDIMLSAPRIIVRPSGTEPKVKIYCEMLGTVGGDEAYDKASARVTKDLTSIVDAFHHWMSGEAPPKALSTRGSLVQQVFSAFPIVNFAPAQLSQTFSKKHTTVLYVAAPHPGPRKWASSDPSCLAWQMQLLFRGVDFVCEHVDEDTELLGGLGKLPFVVLANGNRVGKAQLGRWADHFAPLHRNGSSDEQQSHSPEVALWESLIGGPILAGVLLEVLSLPGPPSKPLPTLSGFVRSSLVTSRRRRMLAEISALQRHQTGPTSKVPGWKTTLEGLIGSGPASVFSTGSAPDEDEEDEDAWSGEAALLDERTIRRDAVQAIRALSGELQDEWRDVEEADRWVDGQGRLDASLFAILHTILSLPIDSVSELRTAVLEEPVLTSWTRRIWSKYVKARGG
ncbi:hypothetical protein L7F22_046466 [Adiantum nelumboides]|nr:hypothetical protein [Adiantum nelumboides]